ncbi:MAG: Uma2 family endonuclease [Dinghuibacter sp.]|nr:Uma2 family endonuclease [Dinghuibacter sp.]
MQPDVFVVLSANSGIVQPNGHVHGTPDLVIEILSPGNKDHDRITKKNLYEQFGVKEYFIADPETKEVLHYLLQEKVFVPQATEPGVLNCRLLNCVFQW